LKTRCEKSMPEYPHGKGVMKGGKKKRGNATAWGVHVFEQWGSANKTQKKNFLSGHNYKEKKKTGKKSVRGRAKRPNKEFSLFQKETPAMINYFLFRPGHDGGRETRRRKSLRGVKNCC